jgi:AraC-like DNA-binding protein
MVFSSLCIMSEVIDALSFLIWDYCNKYRHVHMANLRLICIMVGSGGEGMDDRSYILDRLRAAEELTLRRPYLCAVGPEVMEGGGILPVPRINMILSGRKRAAFPLVTGGTEVALRAGDVQISPPHSWEFHTWDTPHEMLCIVPHPGFLRLSHYRVRVRGKGKAGRPLKENHFYHTDAPWGDGFRQTMQALLTVAHEGVAEAVLPLVGAIIPLARREVERPLRTELTQAEAILRRVHSLMESCFHEALTRESVAAQLHLSPGYLSQLFAAHAELSFKDTLTRIRLDHARRLLRETDLKVYQVGAQCGFGNTVHFVRRFRQRVGLSPGRYRLKALA